MALWRNMTDQYNTQGFFFKFGKNRKNKIKFKEK